VNVRYLFFGILILFAPLHAQDDEPPTPPWNFSVAARYMNLYTNYGLDLSKDKPALGYDVAISHESGLSVQTSAIQTIGTGGELQQWFLGLGYEWQANEWLTFSGEYNHYTYTNDSVNVLAALSDALSFSAEFSLGIVDLGVSYDTFLGSNNASYYGIDISGFYQIENISIVPFTQITFISQQVENRFLKGGKNGNGKTNTITTSSVRSVSTLTGISCFSMDVLVIYPLSSNLSFSFHPSYQYTPKSELSLRASQFVWSAGLRYTFDF